MIPNQNLPDGCEDKDINDDDSDPDVCPQCGEPRDGRSYCVHCAREQNSDFSISLFGSGDVAGAFASINAYRTGIHLHVQSLKSPSANWTARKGII